MRKILTIILFLSSLNNLIAQNNLDEDYLLLKSAIPSIISKQDNSEKPHIDKIPSAFINQEKFFSKDFLINYTYPVPGVDCKKVKKLIKTLNFNYLGIQKRDTIHWDFSKINIRVSDFFYNYNDKGSVKIQQYKISKPIYSQDGKMAFIYYEIVCPFECGSANVKVFKKKTGKWVFYLYIPIWIS